MHTPNTKPEVFSLTGVEHALFNSGKSQGTNDGLSLAGAQLVTIVDQYRKQAAETWNPAKKARFHFVVSVLQPLADHFTNAAVEHKAKGDEFFAQAIAAKKTPTPEPVSKKKEALAVRVIRGALDAITAE